MELATQLWKAKNSEKAKFVLLHGMGGTGSLWRPVAAGLEESFSVLAPDQRGHGKSQLPHTSGSGPRPEYSPLDHGHDLVATLERLNFHPAWVVGHSMGVRSACALSHLKPDWVRGLVLVDLGFSGVAGGGLGENLAAFMKILPMRFNSRAEARSFMELNSPDPSMGQYLMAVSTPTSDGGVTFPFDKAAMIETIHAARDVSIRGWVREFGATGKPVLIMRGASSQVWTHEEFEREKRAFEDLPSIRFEEVTGAGHGLPFEQRALFTQRLRELAGET